MATMKAIIPIAVLFRLIHTVQDEWNGIRKAKAFRGVSIEADSVLKAPFKTVEYIPIPLPFSPVSVMEERASAAMARGMDANHRRTSYEAVRLTGWDYGVMAASALLAACILRFGR